VERLDAGTVRQGDLMELTPRIRDAQAEGVDRSGIALETVNPTTGKLGEEPKRIGAVIASDL